MLSAKRWAPTPNSASGRRRKEPSRGRLARSQGKERNPGTSPKMHETDFASHLAIKSLYQRDPPQASTNHNLPHGRTPPTYTARRTRTRTNNNVQHTAAHAMIDVRSRPGTKPRPTRFVSGKVREYRRRPQMYHHVIPFSKRREVAHGIIRSRRNLNKPIFPHGSGIEIVCGQFSTHQPTKYLRSRHRITPRSTRFVSVKTRAYK